MEHFLEKISSYHFFNYLLPGVVFVAFATRLTSYSFVGGDLIIALFIYYFIGLVVSRFGSLFIEPLLKKIKFLKFGEHSNFVQVSKNNSKIEVLSETSNMYRTLCSMSVLLLVLKVYWLAEIQFPFLNGERIYILLFILLVLFLYSYRKQTNYITKHIKANI